MTEAELDRCVRELAATLRLYAYHTLNSRGSQRGWVDWVLIGPKAALFRENKSEAGQLSPEQTAVGYMLRGVGLDWAVWRPSDWRSGAIQREMEALK